VVLGNPPYKELAVGDGGWVEQGGKEHGERVRPILEDYYDADAGRFKAKLKNLYVYFWRWATWKVWETTPQVGDQNRGVVCFISTAGYLTGPAFTAMREHLRRHASEGWIIDLTPEGQTPDVPTRVFPGVRQPLAIGLFVRRGDVDETTPAVVHHRGVTGRQADKFTQLGQIELDDAGWRPARSDWRAPFTPAAASTWDDFPAVEDLMPWYSPGVFPTRTWVYAPSREILERRWQLLVTETDPAAQAELFKEGRDATLTKGKVALPGTDTHRGEGAVREDRTTVPAPVRVGYRALDRQWVLPDARLMDMPRRDLWAARIPGQVFVIEQHREHVEGGPGLIFSSLMPDFHAFNGRGGRTFPFLHPDGSSNFTDRLAPTLSAQLQVDVAPEDVLAYVAGVTAHPGFTETFADELTTPGVRIPITGDPGLWTEAVGLGRRVIWLHSYGEAYADADARRPAGDVRLPTDDPRRPLATQPVTTMPQAISFDADHGQVHLGDGIWEPVTTAVWEYAIGGRNVVKSWFNYRKANPGGRRSSPLDDVHAESWPASWTSEFTDLLSVLVQLTELETDQEDLLQRIVAGPVLSMADLEKAGVQWLRSRRDRRPRMRMTAGDGALDLD
jgi:predicted helicase